jgi:hypothetical protein
VTQRKGAAPKRTTDRDYPYQVAIPVPGTDLGERSMVMHAWCAGRGLVYRTRADRRRKPVPADYVRFCFGDQGQADAFRAEFGGERITIDPTRGHQRG